MERLKALKQVVWVAGALFFAQLAIFALMLYPAATSVWVSLAVLAVLGLYFMRISLSLLKELSEKEKKD